MSETLFYDPETLADCILENLKCPLLFVCITCYTARPSPLSLAPPLVPEIRGVGNGGNGHCWRKTSRHNGIPGR